MKGGEAIIEALKKHGVDTIFGYREVLLSHL